jgi:hypothetical protein
MRRAAVLLLAMLSVVTSAHGQDGPGQPSDTSAVLDPLLVRMEEDRRPAGWTGAGLWVPLGTEEVDARSRLSRATLDLLTARDAEGRSELRARYSQIADERNQLHRMTLRTIASSPSTRPPVPTLLEVQRALHPGEALVLYGRDEDRMVALVVTPSDARRADLGDRMDAEDRVAAARALLEAEVPDLALAQSMVRRLAVDPLGLDASVVTVLLGADGALATLPPALLFPDRAVAVLPCVSLLRAARRAPDRAKFEVLAVGDPAYRPLVGAPVALPGAAREARGVGTVALVGPDATREALLKHLAGPRRWRALHLAGRVEPDAERPLLSSFGLATTDADDGRWTAREIAQEKISADLVVLSTCLACDTSCVPDSSASALPCAFLVAGVPSVVGFVGTFEDEGGATFTAALYAALREGASAADAVRRAQARIRAEPGRSHPRHWLGWTLWGLP